MAKCALCMKEKELMQSHIIPKFIGKWLKETSATGYLRQAVNPNKRQQDLGKIELLCHECEEKFSSYEKNFAENIFTPFQNGQKEFHYDEWLVKFIISINWRVAVTESGENRSNMPEHLLKELDIAIEAWRKFLNDECTNRGGYTHHMFFLDTIQSVSSGMEVLDHTNWYLLRTVDGTTAYSSEVVFVYSKLPGVIIVSHIQPENMKGWSRTRVSNKGNLKIPQAISVEGFGDFLNHRIRETNRLTSEMSELQRQKIGQNVKNDLEKLHNSKSFEAIQADLFLKGINSED